MSRICHNRSFLTWSKSNATLLKLSSNMTEIPVLFRLLMGSLIGNRCLYHMWTESCSGVCWKTWEANDCQLCTISPLLELTHSLRATSHTCQELWPWNCESPKESVQKQSQHTSKLMWCGHGSSSVMRSHMWPGPQSNATSMNVYSCGFSHMIK